MTNHKQLSKETVEELQCVYDARKEKEDKYRFPLVKSPFGFEEILESIETLLSNKVTMGAKVRAFEEAFAEYIGVSNAIMVNSGSSANLIALAILSNPSISKPIQPKSKIIVPALTWSTSVYPILDIGAVPVFVDSNLSTLNISMESVRNAITPDVRAIMAVHLLGNPCDMDGLLEIASENDLVIIEDCCEAHGAEYQGQKVGSIGEIGTYSFYFSHHISTIEGGMIVTNNDQYAELARVLRAHGWTRDLKQHMEVESKYADRDPRFLFVNRGYNLRPTEIQGAFGIHQIGKLNQFVEHRRKIAKILSNDLIDSDIDVSYQNEQQSGKHSWFAFPLILKEGGWSRRKQVIDYLHKEGIETRVVMGGNMADQPANAMFDYETPVPLDIAKFVDQSGLLIGLHAGLSEDDAVELATRVIKALQNH